MRRIGQRSLAALDRGEMPQWLARSARSERPHIETITGAIREFRKLHASKDSVERLFDTVIGDVGSASLEVSSHSKRLRRRLQEIFGEWRIPFAQCIAEAQAAGEIDSTFESIDLAEFLLASWEGEILRMKVDGERSALDRFNDIVFATIFKEKT